MKRKAIVIAGGSEEEKALRAVKEADKFGLYAVVTYENLHQPIRQWYSLDAPTKSIIVKDCPLSILNDLSLISMVHSDMLCWHHVKRQPVPNVNWIFILKPSDCFEFVSGAVESSEKEPCATCESPCESCPH